MWKCLRLQVLHNVQLGGAVPGFTKQWVKQKVRELTRTIFLHWL